MAAWNPLVKKEKKKEKKKGFCLRTRVPPPAIIPGDRAGFLRIDENKRKLSEMLASTHTERPVAIKQLVNAHSDSVFSSQAMSDASSLQACSHEKADARIILRINYLAT